MRSISLLLRMTRPNMTPVMSMLMMLPHDDDDSADQAVTHPHIVHMPLKEEEIASDIVGSLNPIDV